MNNTKTSYIENDMLLYVCSYIVSNMIDKTTTMRIYVTDWKRLNIMRETGQPMAEVLENVLDANERYHNLLDE